MTKLRIYRQRELWTVGDLIKGEDDILRAYSLLVEQPNHIIMYYLSNLNFPNNVGVLPHESWVECLESPYLYTDVFRELGRNADND